MVHPKLYRSIDPAIDCCLDDFYCTSLYLATNYLPTLTHEENKRADDAMIKAQETENPDLEDLFEATVKVQVSSTKDGFR